MPDIKGTALLPKGEANGLIPIADEIIKEPRRLRAAIVVWDAARGTEDYDKSDTVVTVRVRRWENLLVSDLDRAEELLRRSLEARSGQTVLELELEDEIKRAFKAMKDPTSVADPDEPDAPDAPDPELSANRIPGKQPSGYYVNARLPTIGKDRQTDAESKRPPRIRPRRRARRENDPVRARRH